MHADISHRRQHRRIFTGAFPPCHSDVPPERKPKRGYVRIFPRNENRNEGTVAKTTLLRNLRSIRGDEFSFWSVDFEFCVDFFTGFLGALRPFKRSREIHNEIHDKLPAKSMHVAKNGVGKSTLQEEGPDETALFSQCFGLLSSLPFHSFVAV